MTVFYNKAHPYEGLFLVFDGIDYCGKTTQAQRCYEYLGTQCADCRIHLTREPTDGRIGRLIRRILTHRLPIPPLSLQTLFVVDRREHIRAEVIPCLKRGNIVISDRYDLVTYAYGMAAGCSFGEIRSLHAALLRGPAPRPDTTFILRVRQTTAWERLCKAKKEADFFEQKETMLENARAFDALGTRYPGAVIVDGEGTVAEVWRRIHDALNVHAKFRRTCCPGGVRNSKQEEKTTRLPLR